EAGRFARRPPAALCDVEDAYEWVVERLPDDVASTLTPEDVRRILDLRFKFCERSGVSGNGGSIATGSPAVLGSGDEIAYILERSAATGEAYVPEQVDAVLETQLEYLRIIGAIGPPADPDAW